MKLKITKTESGDEIAVVNGATYRRRGGDHFHETFFHIDDEYDVVNPAFMCECGGAEFKLYHMDCRWLALRAVCTKCGKSGKMVEA